MRGATGDPVTCPHRVNETLPSDFCVEEIMDEAFPTIPEDASLSLINEMLKIYPAIIVIKNGKPLGIISKTDILQKYPL